MPRKQNPKPGGLTPEQVGAFKHATFRPEFVRGVEDARAIGVMVSNYLEWDGGAIIRAFSSALEDANFHKENEAVRKKFHWAFDE
jgi:hypothetical protein